MAGFLALGFLGAASVGAAWTLVYLLAEDAERWPTIRRLGIWFGRGAALPAMCWGLMNIGLCDRLQPFMPQVQAAQNSGGPWFGTFLHVIGSGLFVIGSYWAAVTLGWEVFRVRAALQGEQRQQFKELCRACLVGMAVPAGIVWLMGGWSTLGLAGAVLVGPILGYAPEILRAKPAPPMYARAIARMKFGKYQEAELEIIRELEKCEDDFEGWLMLAELYATRFNDLGEAEHTIIEICDHPKITPPQLSIALHRLADWYLKLAEDPEAARRALQVICDRLKGTHLARMAQLRITQLPVSREDLREQRTAAPIRLPALGDSLDDAPPPPDSEADRRKAEADAGVCVARLNQDPNNIAAREKYARLLAEHLEQVDAAIDQLTLLLDLPGQPELKRAEWFGLIAAWHLRYRKDPESARWILERILRDFPNTPHAMMARRRIQLMTREGRK